MKYSTSVGLTPQKKSIGLLKGIEMYIDSGFDTLDMMLDGFEIESKLRDGSWKSVAAEIRAFADSRGATFNQAHAPFGGGYKRYTEEKLPLMPAVFESCAILGVRDVVVHPVMYFGYSEVREELFDINMKVYRDLAPIAKNFGVRIAIENMWTIDPETNKITDSVCASPEEHIRYYDTLSDPDAFTLCLDVGHTVLCGRDPATVIRQLGRDRLGALHVHDVDFDMDLHTLPYQGCIDFEPLCRALGEIDYKGDLTLESTAFTNRMPDFALPEAIRLEAAVAKNLADKVDSYRIAKSS
jgi:sugar phosphate isomerase/epimerase